jgi:methanogenic corrinoid protein MtbC1
MKEIREQFQKYFDEEDKEKAVLFILDKLKKKDIDVIDLYMQVLTPVLNELTCDLEDQRICIWKEHVKTAIERTIVESCYPYVLEKRDELQNTKKGIVAVVCPPNEWHDIGARMIADFFTISGFDTIFVGSGTPYQDFYNAITTIKPCLIAISISNYFNLVGAKRMIEEIKSKVDHPMKVIVGGNAFSQDGQQKAQSINADIYVRSVNDILEMSKCGDLS